MLVIESVDKFEDRMTAAQCPVFWDPASENIAKISPLTGNRR